LSAGLLWSSSAAFALASVVLPFLWVRGVHILGPNRCAVFMNLLPVLTALGPIAVLGERVHAYHVIGAASRWPA
jgi:drug/metabolite transporter (DMT)-like permease